MRDAEFHILTELPEIVAIGYVVIIVGAWLGLVWFVVSRVIHAIEGGKHDQKSFFQRSLESVRRRRPLWGWLCGR